MEQFSYTTTTPDHSLNTVKVEPEIIEQLKAFCKKNKCHPTQIAEAKYAFIVERNRTKTVYQIVIDTLDGKGPETTAQWIQRNKASPLFHFRWDFGIPTEVAREC